MNKNHFLMVVFFMILFPVYSSELEDQLFKAIEKKDIKLIKELVIKGANVNGKDVWGSTILISASFQGDIEIVKFLIDKGADINGQDKVGWTPLIWACLYKNIEIVKYLIDRGAKLNIKDENGKTALDLVTDQGFTDIEQILKKNGAKKGSEF